MKKQGKRRHLALKIILIGIGSILLCLILVVSTALIYHSAYKVKDIASSIENNTGLIQTEGRGLYDKNGDEIVLNGVNIGNLFVSEGWLSVSSEGAELNEDGSYVKDADGNIQYPDFSEEQFLDALYTNPNLTNSDIDDLLDVYYSNWFSESDVEEIKNIGFNVIRLPFYYRNILDENDGVFTLKDQTTAFKYLDRILEWCKDQDIYCILDLHGCPGSQNGYEHSGEEGEINFWYNETYVDAVVDLWNYVSYHYTIERPDLSPYIASYDIINEPKSNAQVTDKTCWEVFDQIYDAIRENGDLHVITMEGCWSFSTLPNPDKYGWENVMYSYHWYNWFTNVLPYELFYAYQDFSNITKNYDVPVLIGEFTFFDDSEEWTKGLDLFKDRHYSWTLWTYKMAITGSWNNSWGLYNLKLNLDKETEETKINLKTATRTEILNAWTNVKTSDSDKSSIYDVVKNYLNS